MTTVSAHEAHVFAKPLVDVPLKEDDKFYAVDSKWYSVFERFAYLKSERGDEEREQEHPLPPKLNNSDLKRSVSQSYALDKKLVENKDFAWVHETLYNYFQRNFGVEEGSLSFERRVINKGTALMEELIIEMHPIFVTYVMCGADGTPDASSQRTVSISCHSNLKKLGRQIMDTQTADIGDHDGERDVRIWNRKAETAAATTTAAVAGAADTELSDVPLEGWKPFGDDDEDPPPLTDASEVRESDVDDVAIAAIAPADDAVAQESSEPELPPPSYEEVQEEEQDDDDDDGAAVVEGDMQAEDDGWELLNDADCQFEFGEWALSLDLSSSVHYMFEVQSGDGAWRRKHDAEQWRKRLEVGTALDIYDSAYKGWYTGSVIGVDDGDDEDQVKVHYDGYAPKYDEFLPRNSSRLAALHTHTDAFKWAASSGAGGSYYGGGLSSYNADDSTAPQHMGMTGLRNLGNTCYMNSILQGLAHTPLFAHFFMDQSKVAAEINHDNPLGWNGRVADSWTKLLQKYWSGSYSVLSPGQLKHTIGTVQPRFGGYQQHDSSELLQFLLDGLHEDLNRVQDKPYTEKMESNDDNNDKAVADRSWELHRLRNNSIVVDYIQGQIKSKVQCPDCSRISITFDPFMFLSVPLPTVKKYVVKTLTVVHMDLHIVPKKYSVKLPSLSTVSDVMDELEAVTRIPKKRLVIADVWNAHIYKIFKHYEAVDTISDSENHSICYEVPTDVEMKQLLFDAADARRDDIKFSILPIYHQVLKQNTYYRSTQLCNQDIGLPLLIKLPLQCDIDVALIDQYISTMVRPYFQNFEKWDPAKQRSDDYSSDINYNYNSNNNQHRSSGRVSDPLDPLPDDPNITSLDSEDDYDANRANIATMFDEDEEEEEQPQPPPPQQTQQTDVEVEHKEEKEEKEEKTGDGDAEQVAEAEDAAYRSPFSLVLLDKYGKRCGQCGYMSNCDGCTIRSLNGGVLRMTQPMYDHDYRPYAFGVRWKYGAQKCFNHNAFTAAVHDESVALLSASSTKKEGNPGYDAPQKTIHLSDCLNEFVTEETLGKNDAWYCSDCKEHKCATKKLDLYRLPSICIIHLKRFTQNGYYREKNDAPVQYPITNLNLSNWISTKPTTEDEQAQLDCVYDLFAVSIHMGGMGGGHYIAYVKNIANQKWYEYDDSCVTAMDESDVYTSSAYVLFYIKRNVTAPQLQLTNNDKSDESDNSDKNKKE